MAAMLHVLQEGLDHSPGIGHRVGPVEGVPEVKQVPPLLALVKRAEFGPQQFIQRAGQNLGITGEPA
jgi:hypothetical protein